MREIRCVTLDHEEIPVLISDEKEALLAAKAAGGAIVGLWDPEKRGQDLSDAAYLITDLCDADEAYLIKVVKRQRGLPWVIGTTDRLLIREFIMEDLPRLDLLASEKISRERFESYLRCQYPFYGFGYYALLEKETGVLVGTAGFCNAAEEADQDTLVFEKVFPDGDGALDMGYHIFPEYRRQGYALEATRFLLRYAEEEECVRKVILRIRKENIPSLKLAGKLSFRQVGI